MSIQLVIEDKRQTPRPCMGCSSEVPLPALATLVVSSKALQEATVIALCPECLKRLAEGTMVFVNNFNGGTKP